MTSPRTTWTTADLIQSYKASRQNRLLAPATRRNTEKAYRWLTPLHDKVLSDIRKSDINQILDKLPPGNAHIFLSRTRALFAYARSLDEMEGDPTLGLSVPDSGEFRPWKQDEVDAFLKGGSDTVAMAIKLAYYTGQRMSDVLTMKWSDIHDGGIDVVQQKTKTPLHIPLHPNLKTALRLHAKTHKGETIIAMADGKPYRMDSFRSKFREERKKLGLADDLVFHGIRKLTAVSLAEKGASAKEIMAVGGWKTMRQVEHYCKGASQKKLAEQAISKLGAM